MLGLINDCTEQLVVSKFGVDAWHAIKAAAGCDVKDGGFVKHEPYPDSATVDIVVAAAAALGVEVDDVLELFGRYFLEYTRANGYDNLLKCQGSTLRLWLSSLNALHDHLQSSLPTGSFPVFWCEDCDEVRGSIVLHYYSVRGALLAQLVVGLVTEIAAHYFEVEIEMKRLETQGTEGAQCTSWRISAVNSDEQWKLTGTVSDSDSAGDVVLRAMEMRRRRGSSDACDASSVLTRGSAELRCPFTGNAVSSGDENRPKKGMSRVASDVSLRSLLSMHTNATGPTLGTTISVVVKEEQEHCQDEQEIHQQAAMAGHRTGAEEKSNGWHHCHAPLDESDHASALSQQQQVRWNSKSMTGKKDVQTKLLAAYDFGLSSNKVRQIFPYHVMLDRNFRILQVGRRLPGVLGWEEDHLVGQPVMSILRIIKPVLAAWDWPMMQKLSDQIFFLAPVTTEQAQRRNSLVTFKSWRSDGSEASGTGAGGGDKGKVRAVPEAVPDVRFKGSVVQVSRHKAILVLSPDAANISELSAMGLTMSDLPLHSFQRDSVFLGEHIASEVRSAHKLDKLSKRLEHEKNLSNTLLHNMLPEKVADDLRAGKTVEPTHFENVTLFFSDVVGFTTICDSIEPWDVIDMLNQLYSVMDFLSKRFKLYKVETVGDAYMCCSGLPVADEMHAENVANYALAVRECVKHVRSPADGTPLRLRIGIHTGHCMGGVVGTLTPHYCLFGDMVNTTARHESTGMAGKIQCSSVLYGRLKHFSVDENEQYKFTPRGLVSMKGKGECYTYWLDGGTDDNTEASPAAIEELYKEVGEMLAEEKWKKRRYFRRFTLRDNASIASSNFMQSEANLSSADSAAYVGEYKGSGDCDDGNGRNASSSGRAETPDCSDGQSLQRKLDDLDDMISDAESDPPLPLTCPHVDSVDLNNEDDAPPPPCKKDTWAEVGWCPGLTDDELVAHVHELLLDHFHACLLTLPDNLDLLDGQLYGFVHNTARLYRNENGYHHWRHACHVVLGASQLVDFAGFGRFAPWIGFAAVFSALIHDVKHLGVPNAQLQKENHVLVQVFDDGSCQERQSCHTSIKIFIERFPDLSAEVLRGCPKFLHLVTTAVLATDIGSGEAQKKMRERFERVVAAESSVLSDGVEEERSQSVLEHVLLFSDVGHCSQDFDTFLRWNKMFYEECFANFMDGRGDDPRPNWFKGQIGFIQGYILPLAKRCEQLLIGIRPGEPGLVEGTESILQQWKEKGEVWTQKIIDEFEGDDRWRADHRKDAEEDQGRSIVKPVLAPDKDTDATIAMNGGSDTQLGPSSDLESANDEPTTGSESTDPRLMCQMFWDDRDRRKFLCVGLLVAALIITAAILGAKASSRNTSTSSEASATSASNVTNAIGGELDDEVIDPIKGEVGMGQYEGALDAAGSSTIHFGNGRSNIFAARTEGEQEDEQSEETGAV